MEHGLPRSEHQTLQRQSKMNIADTLRHRRSFIRMVGASAAGVAAGVRAATDPGAIAFTPISAPSEAPEKPKPLPIPDGQKVGFALVGLGRLTMNQLMPAFGKSRFAKPTALVSGDRAKALKVAAQFGIDERSVYDYKNFDRIADNPNVKVVYIVLPNSMHAEYTVRAAKAGKHVLCEKPMAISVAECRQMIDACRNAQVKLMIAYRSQYEPLDMTIVKHLREGRFGAIKGFTAYNGQNQGDPSQWRLKRAMAGGGPLPDVGIYCLNAARFLSGEEPTEVIGRTYATPGDVRFKDVEESVQFLLQFPSGWVADCGASYSTHKSQLLRLHGEKAWAELNPAFAYTGLHLRIGSVEREMNLVTEPDVEAADQFARELDHMARCVIDGSTPHTPGEEGLQDQRIVEAIYESARTGRAVKLTPPPGPTRGPDLSPEESA
jgi:predicted dehydrogenase